MHPWLSMASSLRIDNLLVDVATRVAGPGARMLLPRGSRNGCSRALIEPLWAAFFPIAALRSTKLAPGTRTRTCVNRPLDVPPSVLWYGSD